MLQQHYLTVPRKKASNKKRFVNELIENMSFDEFIKDQVSNGITNFYQMTSDDQCLAIHKYYLSYDDLDAMDLFYRRNGTDDLVVEIRRVLKKTCTESQFFLWLHSTIYEHCLPQVERAISEAVREKQPFSESIGSVNEDDAYEAYRESKI